MISTRMTRRWGALVVLALAATSIVYAGGQTDRSSTKTTLALANTDPTVMVRDNSKLGKMLVGPNGMTLYVFQLDSTDKSNCAYGCAGLWPPLTVKSGQEPTKGPGVPGSLGTITRSSGKLQVTYNGMPLYYFVADSAPGDTTGQAIESAGGLWYVVPPKAATFTQAKTLSTHPTATPAAAPKKAWG